MGAGFGGGVIKWEGVLICYFRLACERAWFVGIEAFSKGYKAVKKYISRVTQRCSVFNIVMFKYSLTEERVVYLTTDTDCFFFISKISYLIKALIVYYSAELNYPQNAMNIVISTKYSFPTKRTTTKKPN